ncbi:hypothetical protein [uncultured Maribacter sp.]|uniref:hypothetical protein n=1 Tax=uncultured Maribacter sp. TaxID=431308 RepID=UPI002624BFFB|nr:hypothetical protein [uncultured Maribacter sp.]
MKEQDKNPFKKLQGELKEVPPELRKKVMDDVAMAKLMMDLATLFTGNYSALIDGLLKTSNRNKNK